MKPSDIPLRSAIQPISRGATAPPTILIIRKEEANFVWRPTPRSDKAKMVGNIIELKSPNDRRVIIEKSPLVLMESRMSIMLLAPAIISILEGEKQRVSLAPIKRPTIAPPQ